MRKAFSMLELVFVIVVIGILSASLIQNTDRNTAREAAEQIVNHVRYTQHLALSDDKYDSANNQWYLGRWQIAFSSANGTKSYRVFAERQGAYNGNPDCNAAYSNSEVAVNPNNLHNFLIGTADSNFANNSSERISKKLDLGNSYGIVDFSITGGSTGSNSNGIIFDSLGRPYRGNTNSGVVSVINSPVNRLATSPIFIKICTETCTGANDSANNDDEAVIKVENETGYACILKENSNSECL